MTDVFDDLAKAFKAGLDAGRSESADEIEQLRDALICVVAYWDEWKDAPDNHPTALSLEEVVNIARTTLEGRDP